MTQVDNDQQTAVLSKLGEITETAIQWADLYEEEAEKEAWNRDHPTQQKSAVKARTSAAARLQTLRKLVKELHSL
jgi:hypothetical protein